MQKQPCTTDELIAMEGDEEVDVEVDVEVDKEVDEEVDKGKHWWTLLMNG